MKKKLGLYVFLILFFMGSFLVYDTINIKIAKATPIFQKINYLNAKITARHLNMRQGPGIKFPIVCVLRDAQMVKVFGKMEGWYFVYEPIKGCIGAVSSKYVKLLENDNKPLVDQKQKSVPKSESAKLSAANNNFSKNATSGITKDEQVMLNFINKARVSAGVSALEFDMELQRVAKIKADDMVRNKYFSHQSPTYGSPFDMMRQFGIKFKTAAENIAGNRTAEGAFNAWMNSSGHRKNILNRNFNYTGIGIANSSSYGKIFVQQFIGK